MPEEKELQSSNKAMESQTSGETVVTSAVVDLTLPLKGLIDQPNNADENAGSVVGASKSGEKTLAAADELFQKGRDAFKAGDLENAIEFFGQALEIRVAHYGDLAPECATYYFKYGSALLYKAQEEADPLNGNVPLGKTKQASQGTSTKEPPNDPEIESETNGEIVASDKDQTEIDVKGKSIITNGEENGTPCEEAKDAGAEESDGDEDAEGNGEEGVDQDEANTEEADDEEESDLALAWKHLETARVILDKQGDTIEKAEVISALGDVSLEREDFSTATDDYKRALSILEHLKEAESRHIAQLCFKVSLSLQMQNEIPQAIEYCQKALSLCSTRMQKLKDQVDSSKSEDTEKDVKSDSNDESVLKALDEIKVLEGLMTELSEKVEDLKQMLSEPSLPELFKSLANAAAEKKAGAAGSRMGELTSQSSNGFDTPKLSTNEVKVTDLGVVGRGVKRAAPQSIDVSEQPKKRTAIDPCAREPNGTTVEPLETTTHETVTAKNLDS
eukprot:TRINITY_DN4919_c0_g1_i1.p1 TRINITY_DN4919_c0_g1~~TRINITY_DN4919_c0_g1_i1.p1  ORF type:complete len:503 (+),score=120.63 TRINITY_DN4919_c0_g1_i1:264-1772(+)